MRRLFLLSGIAIAWLIPACAKVDPRHDFAHASRHVEEAIGMPVPERAANSAPLPHEVDALLANGLTSDEAVQVTLINNPRIRTAFASIGMARADVVQSGLFSNPGLSLAARFPDGGGLANIEAGLSQNIADFWLIPVRQRAAEEDLNRRILSVAREVSLTALAARSAYFRAVSAAREQEIAAENRDLARKLVESTQGRQQAAASSVIDVNLAQAGFLEADLAMRAAVLLESETRAELVSLMGLASPLSADLLEELPEATALQFAPDQVLGVSQAVRLDLLAADREVAAAEARLAEEKRSVFSEVEVGVSLERDERRRGGNQDWLSESAAQTIENGRPTSAGFSPVEDESQDVIAGPSLSLELPIFDQNQAQIAKAQFALEVARNERDALAVQISQEMRLAYDRARTAWETASLYREELVPLLQSNLDLSLEAYRAGKISFLSVLETQQQLLASRGRYVRALRDSATFMIDLEKAAGRPMRDLLNPSPGVSSTNTSDRQVNSKPNDLQKGDSK